MASTYLSRTLSTPTNNKIWTWSCWFKKSSTPASWTALIEAGSGSVYFSLGIDGSERLILVSQDEGAGGVMNVWSSQVIRDLSGWYHYVVAYDSTQATASDRVKGYINGEEITSFSNTSYPDLNKDTYLNGAYEHRIGRRISGTYYDGSMAHVHFIDGTAYDASAFGETNAASGIWTPIASPSVTYGTNGFFLKFGSSGALGTDSSGNSNTFTVNGSGTQTQDAPSNVFATMNPLVRYTANPTFTNGNLSFTGGGGSDFAGALGTFAMTQGKWFWECKISATLTNTSVGVQQVGLNLNTSEPQNITGGTTCFSNNDGGEMKTDGTATTNDYGTFSDTDIMGVAINMDDKQISIYKNGTAIVSNFALSASSTEVLPFFAMYSSGAIVNFGNGFFGTTAVASGNADGAGYGIFEYAPPTGYYSLCTKNINTYG